MKGTLAGGGPILFKFVSAPPGRCPPTGSAWQPSDDADRGSVVAFSCPTIGPPQEQGKTTSGTIFGVNLLGSDFNQDLNNQDPSTPTISIMGFCILTKFEGPAGVEHAS